MYAYPSEKCMEKIVIAVERVEKDDVEFFIVDHRTRGFREYRKLSEPKINQSLLVKSEKFNVYYPYVVGL